MQLRLTPSSRECKEILRKRKASRIFHNEDHLKGDNYEEHKKEVAEKLNYQNILLTMSLEFIGYCLPDISFLNEIFTETL
jgi:hypothetical protein